jgi:hypothetical protein
VYVHGGGWTRGDKSEIHKNPRLLEFLPRNGCLVASVNFRPIQTNEARKVTYADQAHDIAAALKWLSNHVEKFGGRPEGFILLGHSSGAHLCALVALDDRYLSNQGLDGSWVKGVISMDVHSYDIPAALRLPNRVLGERCPEIVPVVLLRPLGRTPSDSEQSHVQVVQGFAHGHRAVHVHLEHCDHHSILSRFGSAPERVLENIKDFLEIATPSRGPAIRTQSKILASSLASNTEISEERKREAVRLAETTNRPAVEIAREFGVPCMSSILGGSNSTGTAAGAIRPRAERGSVRRGPGNSAPPVQNSIEQISEERQRRSFGPYLLLSSLSCMAKARTRNRIECDDGKK